MEQFLVPQFIDVEDKIIGPVTMRQFVLMLISILLGFLLYQLLPFIYFVVAGVLDLAFFAIISFARVNGRPIHFFLLNFAQTFKKPNVRVWNKESFMRDIKVISEKAEEKIELPTKKMMTGSRLNDLTLTINTGGVYAGLAEEVEEPLEPENRVKLAS
ncbi:PrgI family protein [Patescibacteria group bacterium]|nr:PrgI family protein [Patescibacteria group bacterium]